MNSASDESGNVEVKASAAASVSVVNLVLAFSMARSSMAAAFVRATTSSFFGLGSTPGGSSSACAERGLLAAVPGKGPASAAAFGD
eukprot:2043635-Alexandrium_andersonii.AAC.1